MNRELVSETYIRDRLFGIITRIIRIFGRHPISRRLHTSNISEKLYFDRDVFCLDVQFFGSQLSQKRVSLFEFPDFDFSEQRMFTESFSKSHALHYQRSSEITDKEREIFIQASVRSLSFVFQLVQFMRPLYARIWRKYDRQNNAGCPPSRSAQLYLIHHHLKHPVLLSYAASTQYPGML